MPKEQWEENAKNRFVTYIQQLHGQQYAVTGENVVTNPLTRRDFDYELTAIGDDLPVIALEIFRIVGDEMDLGHHKAWNDIAFRLGNELKERGVTGYFISTPHFYIPKSKLKQFAS